jgi:hypothetical protein
MDGLAINHWTAKNGWLSNGRLGDGQLCDKMVGCSGIKRWKDLMLMNDGQCLGVGR